MKFEHTITIDASIEEVRELFEDVPAVAACLPGVEGTTAVAPDLYAGKLRVKVGPLSFTLEGQARVAQPDADGTWRLNAEGRDGRIGTGVNATLEAHLRETASRRTELQALADVQFWGRLGELGQPLIRRKAEAMLQDFAVNLQRKFNARS